MEKTVWRQERGEVMLESMIVMLVTMFVLLWLMALGFVYYQRYVTTVVTNDAAVKIASTYNNVSSDIVMGYVNTEALSGRDLYRRFSSGNLESTNEDRAQAYIRYILDQANFVGVVEEVDVELKLELDSTLRRHVELTTTCTYNTPLGQVMEFLGMNRQDTYQVKACADCTDYADYISTVDYQYAWASGAFGKAPGVVGDAITLINTLVKTYNHFAGK